MTRPVCVHCGATYGQRFTSTEVIVYPKDQEEPAYKGNGIVIKSKKWATGGGSGSTGSFGFEAKTFGPTDIVVYRDIWDGESWSGGCRPFCTNRCAIDYARKVYKIYGLKIGES